MKNCQFAKNPIGLFIFSGSIVFFCMFYLGSDGREREENKKNYCFTGHDFSFRII